MFRKFSFFSSVLVFLAIFLKTASAAPSVFHVTNSSDSNTYTAGSLRWAVAQANQFSDPSTIIIDPLTAPIEIALSSTLTLNYQTIIEGNGATITTSFAVNLMELGVGSNGSSISGLALHRTAGGFTSPLLLVSSNFNTITGCRIGTDWPGTTAYYNGKGLSVTGWHNLIGGNRTAGEHNVLSGDTYGIELGGGGNTVCGNIVGLSADQSSANGNVSCGIGVWGVGNAIGLPQAGKGNVICSNQNYGLQISGNNNRVQNNLLGVNEAGTKYGNSRGILSSINSMGNLFGGARNAGLNERNIISGNAICQVEFGGQGNTLSGNLINTNLTGDAELLPLGEKAAIYGDSNGSHNLIGGSEGDASHLYGNVLCGKKYGIWCEANDQIQIQGNRIGMLDNGVLQAATLDTGVLLEGDSTFAWRMGTKNAAAEGNIIAKSNTGVAVTGGHAAFYGNLIRNFSSSGIRFYNNGNNNKAAPVITWVGPSAVSGTAASGDFIEVYRAENRAGGQGGSLAYLGSTTAVGTQWSLSVSLTGGDFVCALATDGSGNTSLFSTNALVPGGVSPTVTATPVITATPNRSYRFPDQAVAHAFPNPARDQVRFAVRLDETAQVQINIYNYNGERVSALSGTFSNQGASLDWNCKTAGPGIYLARINVNQKEVAKLKVAVVK